MSAFDILMAPPSRNKYQQTSSGYLVLKGINTIEESECYLLQFDGASKSNPGPSSGGAILYSRERKPLYEVGEYIIHATNNIAEYTGLQIGLRVALENGMKYLLIEGDSQLVVQQVSGAWKIDNDKLKVLNKDVKQMINLFDFVAIRHIRRDFNKEADRISNESIQNKETYITEYEYT